MGGTLQSPGCEGHPGRSPGQRLGSQTRGCAGSQETALWNGRTRENLFPIQSLGGWSPQSSTCKPSLTILFLLALLGIFEGQRDNGDFAERGHQPPLVQGLSLASPQPQVQPLSWRVCWTLVLRVSSGLAFGHTSPGPCIPVEVKVRPVCLHFWVPVGPAGHEAGHKEMVRALVVASS